MLSAILERIENGAELTQSEFEAVKQLVKVCTVGFSVTKVQKRTSKIPLGEFSEQPVNPATAYEYGYETGGELRVLMRKNGWCGQFAGKSQWEALNRAIKAGEQPALSYNSIYKKPINLFSYEQTE